MFKTNADGFLEFTKQEEADLEDAVLQATFGWMQDNRYTYSGLGWFLDFLHKGTLDDCLYNRELIEKLIKSLK